LAIGVDHQCRRTLYGIVPSQCVGFCHGHCPGDKCVSDINGYWWTKSWRNCVSVVAAAVGESAPCRACRVSADTTSTPVIRAT
jgi:hypothetical protein